ncbi:LysR family transcriptional regulator [Streptomyces huiliensis]|uniref:LysR family transcriptional regulator n=1 Tax=Streptomyces huiliensis TaxID=2876027 RepID=UPI001CC0A10F|nr:LysR family transcriptional regulator [Streptomyces huiliensis]MBZ4324483.1 LysR family transcriptional regulator [Streptomyces huiliensis]
MNPVHVQEIECLLALAEELHFGRTATRLGCSQSRVSQLVAALERHVGARLVERTSRRVELTRLGAQFVDEVRPAHQALTTAFDQARERARRGALCRLRVGFQGNVYEEVTEAFRRLRAHHQVTMALSEIPLGSPFTAVLDHRVDAAVVELPAREPELTVGFRFPPQDRFLAVATSHPLSGSDRVHAEELAGLDVLHPAGDAPDYWMAAHVPRSTPAGAPIHSTRGISGVQEGLALVAAEDHAMFVCRPLAERVPRGDVRYVLVEGLGAPSQMGLVWRTDRTTPQLTALAGLLHEEFTRTALPAAPRSARPGPPEGSGEREPCGLRPGPATPGQPA